MTQHRTSSELFQNLARHRGPPEPQHVGKGFRWFFFYLALIAIACIASAFFATKAHAQTCTVGGQNSCFVGSKTSGESPIATTLTWNVVGATACSASGGGTPWSGTVATSGTKNLSGITVKMTLTLDCTAPATAGKMRVSWTPPLQNTDGTLITALGGYYIDYGTAAGALNQTINLAVPGATTYDVTGLTAGTWFVTVRAATPGCFPSTTVTCYVSQQANVASKAVTTTPGGNLPQLAVVLDPYQVPKPPTTVTVSDVTAMEIKPNSSGELVASRVGLVPIGTRCYDEQRVAAGVTYNGIPIELVDFVNWPSVTDLREAWAKCGA